MTNVKRILHIAPGEPFGGLQRIVLNLASKQTTLHEVAVLWTGKAEQAKAEMHGQLVEDIYAEGSLIVRITEAVNAVRRFKPDIIHLHMAPPWIALALLNARAGICFHLHGLPSSKTGIRGWLAFALERWLIARSEVLIAISDWLEAVWRERFPAARYRRVYNGIPCSFGEVIARPIAEANPPVIGFGSRLADDKGVAEFARFVLALHERIPYAHFRVAGEGPERVLLEEMLGTLEARGLVQLVGHLADMGSFWSQLDVAIFSAPREPFGLRLIEPVAEGVPVVAYETGAGSDEIAWNCAGIATVPYDNPEAMAELVVQLLDDPARRREMVLQGRKDLVQKFSIESMATGIDSVYGEASWIAGIRKG